MKQSEIAAKLHLSVRQVLLITKKYQQTHSVKDLPRKSKARASTKEDDKRLVRRSLNNPALTASELLARWEKEGVHASLTTVKDRLKKAGLVAHVSSKVVFSDEKKLKTHNQGRTYVRFRAGKPPKRPIVRPQVKHPVKVAAKGTATKH